MSKKNSAVLLTLHQFTPTLPLNRLKHCLQSAVNRIVPQFSKHQPSIAWMCRKSTSPPTRKAFYTSCVCAFLPKKKAMKRVWPNVFKAFRNQNQIFFVFSFGPNPDTRFGVSLNPSRLQCLLLPRHDPTAKKMSHRSGSVSPVFSPIFFGMLQWLHLHKTHQNLPRLQKIPPRFFITKKRPNVQNCRFQATHSLPWPKSAPPFSVPTNER